jgi:NitT/TauT family transport system substrate-binding protein
MGSRMRRLAALALVPVALALPACGDDDDGASASSKSGGELVKVNVGVLPLAAVTPVYLGQEKGFFREEGLDVTPQQTQGGAATLPSVISGDFQFGYSNNVSLLLASVEGLPIEIVSNGNDEAEEVDQINSVVVSKKGSAIKQPADLAGKKIAVNTLNNIGDVTVKAALQKKGVDISGLEFVELPFPEMIPALERGRVDAAWLVEPFSYAAKAAGHQVIIQPFYDTKPGLSIATYFTSKKYAEQNPEIVDSFVRAMNKSLEYTAAHPDELRSTLLKFTEIPPEVADKMALPTFTPKIKVDDIKLTGELMEEFGLIDEQPDWDTLIRPEG